MRPAVAATSAAAARTANSRPRAVHSSPTKDLNARAWELLKRVSLVQGQSRIMYKRRPYRMSSDPRKRAPNRNSDASRTRLKDTATAPKLHLPKTNRSKTRHSSTARQGLQGSPELSAHVGPTAAPSSGAGPVSESRSRSPAESRAGVDPAHSESRPSPWLASSGAFPPGSRARGPFRVVISAFSSRDLGLSEW